MRHPHRCPRALPAALVTTALATMCSAPVLAQPLAMSDTRGYPNTIFQEVLPSERTMPRYETTVPDDPSAELPAHLRRQVVNYPTRDKSPEEQRAARDECRRDAEHARRLGFRGKWTGIPAQCPIVKEVFQLEQSVIDEAVRVVRGFLAAERGGRGAAMIDGKMADRATDRMQRVVLETAWASGRLTADVARELGIA